MFGTFCEEKDPVVYGLTHPVNTFNPISLQIHSYKYLWERIKGRKSWSEVFSILFKGSGWEEGKPRLGLIEDIEDVSRSDPNLKPYDPPISQWYQAYCGIHFFVILLFHILMIQGSKGTDSRGEIVISFFFILFSLTSLGSVMDGAAQSRILELVRCVAFFWIQKIYLPIDTLISITIRAIYYLSIATWFLSLVHKELPIIMKAHKKSS